MSGKLTLLPRSFRECKLIMNKPLWKLTDFDCVEQWVMFDSRVYAGTQAFFCGASTRPAVRKILHPTMEKAR